MSDPAMRHDAPGRQLKTIRSWLLLGAVSLTPFILLFYRVIFYGEILAFRDSWQFYFPLFKLIQQEWEQGRIPLWNMYSNAGEPLLGSVSSSVLYPGKLIFFSPLDYATNYHIYLLSHIIGAGVCMAFVCHRWGLSKTASTFAAISYAYSGNVIYQYCNVIYLVAACWLPLSIYYGYRAVQERSISAGLLASCCLSLILLGGDPQTAYLSGVSIAIYAFLNWVAKESLDTTQDDNARGIRFFLQTRLGILALIALSAGLMSAAQILPSREMTARSVRAMQEVPRNIYQVPGYLFSDHSPTPRPDTGLPPHWYDAMLGDPPPPAKHEIVTYNFSFEPWRVIEFVWPNITGNEITSAGRTDWLQLYDLQKATWVPSQYLGLLPLIAAIGMFSLGGLDVRRRWLSWISLLFLLASFGYFGMYWAIKCCLGSLSEVELQTSGALGGVYWLMSCFMPLFSDFRYPAKLMLFTTMGICFLAGFGFEDVIRKDRRSTQIALCIFIITSLCGIVGIYLFEGRILESLQSAALNKSVNVNFTAALQLIQRSFLHTLILSGMTLSILLFSVRYRVLSFSSSRILILLLTAADLGFASAALVESISMTKPINQQPTAVNYLNQALAQSLDTSSRPVRIFRPTGWMTPHLRLEDQELTRDEYYSWLKDTLCFRNNLPFQIGKVADDGTIYLNHYATWFDPLPLSDMDLLLQPRRAFDLWGTQFFVIPPVNEKQNIHLTTTGLTRKWGQEDSPDWHPIFPLGNKLDPVLPGIEQPLPDLSGTVILKNDNPFPPCWITHRAVAIMPIDDHDRATWMPLMQTLVFPANDPPDLRKLSVIEDSQLHAEWGETPRTWNVSAHSEEQCQITHYEADRIEIEAKLSAPGIVVLSDTYYPGWQLDVSTEGGAWVTQEILRTNRSMRGVYLPAGQHLIRYRYVPTSFYLGAVISLMSISAVLYFLLMSRRQTPSSEANQV